MLRVLDNVFLVLAGIYMAFMVYTMSMFPGDTPVIAKVILLGLMLLVAGMRVLLIGLKNRKVWIGTALCVVYCGVFYVSDNSNFLFLAACTMGFLEIEYQKIIRAHLIAVGTALLIVVGAAMIGLIENHITYKQGNKRQSMGTIYPTDFSSLVLFLLMYLWVSIKRAPDWALLPLPIFSFLIAWKVTYSITSMICSALFLVFILFNILERGVISKHLYLRAVSDWMLALLIVFLAGAMVYVVLQYDSGNEKIQRLNDLMTRRIAYAYRGWKNYGIHPFGSYFELVGAGVAKNPEQVAGQSYNFIDCSYLLILIRYGFVLFFAVLTVWVITTRRVQMAGDQRLALVMALIAIHSIAEHHMIDMHYNIAIAMPLAAFVTKQTRPGRAQPVLPVSSN